jgi:hypothetical protein
MKLKERIEAFDTLGTILRNVLNGKTVNFAKGINNLIDNLYKSNPWFTPENVRSSINVIANELTYENLTTWTNSYPGLNEERIPLRVGVIMAGNIPLVGFHDFLSVLISGNDLIIKTSSKDSELISAVSDILFSINPAFRDKVVFKEGPLESFDVVIATGSNNSSRYFEYYFGKYPNIIRKNRNSVAIIDGNETGSELRSLGRDIFLYFGLGCRNVSKIYVPRGYDFSHSASSWDEYASLIHNTKYAHNYDFNKAVYLVNKENFYDTGYLLIKEDRNLASPVAVLHYESYESKTAVKHELMKLSDNIQCIVGRDWIIPGEAQSPKLWDYADGIDTIEFLLKKNMSGIM